MLIVFEVYVAQGQDADDLLTEETKQTTQAQVMTIEEAAAVGFTGIQPDPKGRQTRLIAVAPRDRQWVQRALETHSGVAQFRVHEVET
jgi:hypothetical protein